jgi:uncharacterized membrane protein YccF (DUF307 family)
MSFIGNVLWIVLGGGIVLFFEYLLAGLVTCATLIGVPFGLQAFKLAGLALLPFGREVYPKRQLTGCLSTVGNLIWLVFGGIWIALTHLLFAFLCAITIIGIPFAHQHLKLATLALSPFGKFVSRW